MKKTKIKIFRIKSQECDNWTSLQKQVDTFIETQEKDGWECTNIASSASGSGDNYNLFGMFFLTLHFTKSVRK